MALYRATQLLLNRIMSGRVSARAFFTLGAAKDQATPGDEGVSGVIEGTALRDLIDMANMTFDLPLTLRTSQESIAATGGSAAQPTVRIAVPLDVVGLVFRLPMRGGPLFMNRNFELDLPLGDNYASVLSRALVGAGLIATAGSLADAGIPAALNSRLAGLPAHEPAVS